MNRLRPLVIGQGIERAGGRRQCLGGWASSVSSTVFFSFEQARVEIEVLLTIFFFLSIPH